MNLADVTIYEMRMLIRDASDLLVVDIGKVKGPNGQAGFVDGAPVVPSSAICDLGVADDGVVKLSDDIDEITRSRAWCWVGAWSLYSSSS